jgi:hypothetical protein
MATSKTVWFAEGTEKYFNTRTEAETFEKQLSVMKTISAAGVNDEAAKKAAKAIIAGYDITAKAVAEIKEPIV